MALIEQRVALFDFAGEVGVVRILRGGVWVKRPASGLRRMALPDGEEQQMDPGVFETGWDIGPDGAYILRDRVSVDFLDFRTLRATRIADNLGDKDHDVHETSVSPGGRWLLYTRHDRIESPFRSWKASGRAASSPYGPQSQRRAFRPELTAPEPEMSVRAASTAPRAAYG